MPAQLQFHHFQHCEAVRRPPRRQIRAEQEKFWGPSAKGLCIHGRNPGIYPVGVGFERGKGVGILYRYGCGGRSIEVKPAQQLVCFHGARAEHFRQAPLCGPTHHRHLPQPVLGMGNTQPEKHIAICLGKDMGDIVRIAHDLNRALQAIKLPGCVVVGQGAGAQVPNRHHGHTRQNGKCGKKTNQPREDQCHGSAFG